MNLKKLLLFTLVIGFISVAFAEKVTLNEAKQVARNFYYEKYNQYEKPINIEDIILGDVHIEKNGIENTYYAFNIENGGFVIVSAEDVLDPVFGFAFKGSYSPENQPDNYIGWMQHYSDMVVWARETNYQPEQTIVNLWELLLTTDIESLSIRGGRDVAALLTSTWNQDSPYNMLAPEAAGGPGGRCYAGCVATCMAQIMYYWRYPLQGSGDHTYYHPDYGYLEANFGETYYDWTAMRDEVNGNSHSHSIYAVAELQYHAGVAVNMNFDPNGSGAFSATAAYALETYFNYSTALSFVNRSSYTQQTWDALLMNNIDNGRPMYYRGEDGTSGHAFVCDGYQEGTVNYFHFNFGWSGSGDGFYTASNAGGFPNSQGVIRNIYPDDITYQYPYYCDGPSIINTTGGSIEDGSGPYVDYENNANCSWLLAPDQDSVKYFTISFIKFDTESSDILTIYDGETTSDPVLGSFSGNTIPDNLVSSGDKVLITFETNGSGAAPGWLLEYSASQPSFCNMVTYLSEPSGTFSDGSGDWKYRNNTFCRWTIDVPLSNSISLSFPFFDTEVEYDYIKILDYSTSPPTELGVFSGSFPPPTITGVGPITVIFMTNKIINKQGWTIYYEIDNVGTDEIEMVSYFNMFPNPVNDLLNVEFILPEAQKIELSILNLTGSVIYSEALGEVKGRNTLSIDVSGFTQGVYLLRLVGDKGILNKRVIVR